MFRGYLWSDLDALNFDNMWFQQDVVTYNTANQTIYLLKEMFGETITSKNGPVNYPRCSCDITSLDFFLWGYVIDVRQQTSNIARFADKHRTCNLWHLSKVMVEWLSSPNGLPNFFLFFGISTDACIQIRNVLLLLVRLISLHIRFLIFRIPYDVTS